MPRKNNVRSERRGGRHGRSADRFPIDWEAAEAAHRGGEPDRSPRRTGKKDKLHNEFTRKLTGFSDSALDVILRYGFDQVDETGAVPIVFKGISKRGASEIGYDRPGLVVSRGGFVVISGVIGKEDRNEVGLGESGEIRRASSEPVLNSHNSANRFNVALGRQPQGVKEHALAGELLDGSTLVLSRITEVNGHVIEPDAAKWEIDEHWEVWDEPPSYGLGVGGYDSRWDEPGPLSGSYW